MPMMKFIPKLLLAAVVIAGTLGWAMPSRADLIETTIFDNTGAPGTLGSQSIGTGLSWAQGFQTGANAMDLHRVSLLLESVDASFTVNLYTASGGVPNTLVANLHPTGDPGSQSFGTPFVMLKPLAEPFTTLAANTSYFIAVENTNIGGSLAWRTVTPDTSLGRAKKDPSTAPWSSSSGPELMMKLEQFEDVAAVPEPGSMLFASAVCGGGLLVKRWRRRKA